MAIPHQTGSAGEARAAAFLEAKGFRILHRNWRHGHLEIDLAALDGDILVIVEVKTRSTNAFGAPETFVTPAKQKKLIRAANFYLEAHGLHNEVRFDVVSVLLGEKEALVHLPGAFSPGLK